MLALNSQSYLSIIDMCYHTQFVGDRDWSQGFMYAKQVLHLAIPCFFVKSLGTSALAALEAETNSGAYGAFPWGKVGVVTERI